MMVKIPRITHEKYKTVPNWQLSSKENMHTEPGQLRISILFLNQSFFENKINISSVEIWFS